MAVPRLHAAIAYLAQFYPRQAITPALVSGYVAELQDLPVESVEAAVRRIVRTAQWFPTVAEVRAAAAEEHLALPDEAAALAAVEAYCRALAARRRVECPECDGRGEVAATRGRPEDGPMECENCRGEGERWDVPLPALHPTVRKAFDLVGGAYGFKNADSPSVLRSQFLRLYAAARAGALEGEQRGVLASGPLALPGAIQPNMPTLRGITE